MIETETVEFKLKLNDKLEKEVVAFLNTTKGGEIYVGVDDNGNPVGLEDIDNIELQIKDRIKNNIAPSTMGLFEIVTSPKKDFVKIVISGGDQRPYYVRKYGMCPEGCFIRIGTSVEKMNEEMILSLFQKRDKRTLKNIVSERQDLTFKYLKKAYKEKGYEVSKNFLIQLECFTSDRRYNLLAYLLSDQFSSPFQYARYSDNDIFDLAEQKAFANQSIVKTAIDLLELFQYRNSIYTKITPLGREDNPKFQPIAVREIVINAIVHNDYRLGGLPTFEEFSSHLEISSFGGLPEGFTKDDFLNGYSLPFNPELIRVFRDLGLAERLGTGIRRVLKFYPKEIFSFSQNFLRVNVPFYKKKEEKPHYFTLAEGDLTVLDLIRAMPNITRKKVAQIMQISESTAWRNISDLVKEGVIERVGSNKSGHWVIKKEIEY